MCTPAEAAKDNQYRLLCDGMLRRELMSTQAAWIKDFQTSPLKLRIAFQFSTLGSGIPITPSELGTFNNWQIIRPNKKNISLDSQQAKIIGPRMIIIKDFRTVKFDFFRFFITNIFSLWKTTWFQDFLLDKAACAAGIPWCPYYCLLPCWCSGDSVHADVAASDVMFSLCYFCWLCCCRCYCYCWRSLSPGCYWGLCNSSLYTVIQ